MSLRLAGAVVLCAAALALASPAGAAQRSEEGAGGGGAPTLELAQTEEPEASEPPSAELPVIEEPASDDEIESIDDSWLDEEELGPDPAERDHTPRWNRRVFNFNEGFIRWVMQPITRGYQAITPKFVREMIHRGFENLDGPGVFVNDVLQLDPCRAGRTLGRFALNTTAGLAGMFDVAAEMGIERHDTDFGETLGRYGVRSGSFFMLPVLGPSTARDTFGEIVDTALSPEVWLLGGFPRLAVTGGNGLSTYDIQGERLDALRDTSVDFYAALRSAYIMDRDARIEDLRNAGRCGFGRKSEADAAPR